MRAFAILAFVVVVEGVVEVAGKRVACGKGQEEERAELRHDG